MVNNVIAVPVCMLSEEQRESVMDAAAANGPCNVAGTVSVLGKLLTCTIVADWAAKRRKKKEPTDEQKEEMEMNGIDPASAPAAEQPTYLYVILDHRWCWPLGVDMAAEGLALVLSLGYENRRMAKVQFAASQLSAELVSFDGTRAQKLGSALARCRLNARINLQRIRDSAYFRALSGTFVGKLAHNRKGALDLRQNTENAAMKNDAGSSVLCCFHELRLHCDDYLR